MTAVWIALVLSVAVVAAVRIAVAVRAARPQPTTQRTYPHRVLRCRGCGTIRTDNANGDGRNYSIPADYLNDVFRECRTSGHRWEVIGEHHG